MSYSEIIQFWFEEIDQKKWWVKDEEFDAHLKTRFGAIHEMARKGELFNWRETAPGRLAEIIVLDQFSRNMFRGHPKSFSQDPMALVLAQEAVRLGVDQELKKTSEQMFLYMPYMHSESKVVHREAQRLFDKPGMEGNLDFEMKHYRIIERFGRYPHRNEILGRTSTPEEKAFLKEPDSSF